MSVPVFIRHPDGTAWEGRIAYKWSAVREDNLRIKFGESSMPSLKYIYALYGVCPALNIPQERLTNANKLDLVYTFLYGYTLKELMEVEKEETYSKPGEYIHEPKEWTSQMVDSMDWDLFCLAYYTFLCSENSFETRAWQVLSFILKTLKDSPNVLYSLLLKAGKSLEAIENLTFWDTICNGLQIRTREYLHEKTCYTAFRTMMLVRPFFTDERYKSLEYECLTFVDKVARKRIDDAHKKTYTVRELLKLDVELLFFYDEYFAYASENTTKKYVTNSIFILLSDKGDKIVTAGEIIEADAVYEAALKYTQTEEERNIISNKRSKIALLVSYAKAEREKERREKEKKLEEEYRENEKKLEKARRKNKVSDNIAKIFAAIFLISVMTTILFGIFTLFGLFNPFSRYALIVSLCIVVPFLIILGDAYIKDKRG